MLRSIFNFCFWTKNWSIDHALSDKSTKRGGPKCRSAQEEWGWGGRGRRETGLQLSAIFNVGYVLGTSLRKEAGNTTLECCFSLNMDAVNVDFVRDLVVTQGKTHSQVSLLLQEAYPGKRGLSSRSVRRFCLKNGIHAQNRLSNEELEHYTKEVVARVGIFAWNFYYFFSRKEKMVELRNFLQSNIIDVYYSEKRCWYHT